MWCSEVGSWELGLLRRVLAGTGIQAWYPSPDLTLPAQTCWKHHLHLLLFFFRYLPNCDVYVYLRKYQSVPSSFSIWNHPPASGKSSQLAGGRSNSQHLHLICPKILFAQKDYLPRIIICPKILFARKYYLSRKNFCSEILRVQKHFLLSNIICSEISFAQKYYLLRNDISSDIIFVQKYFYFSAKYLIWIFCPSSKYLLVLAGILVIHLSPSLEKCLNFWRKKIDVEEIPRSQHRGSFFLHLLCWWFIPLQCKTIFEKRITFVISYCLMHCITPPQDLISNAMPKPKILIGFLLPSCKTNSALLTGMEALYLCARYSWDSTPPF